MTLSTIGSYLTGYISQFLIYKPKKTHPAFKGRLCIVGDRCFALVRIEKDLRDGVQVRLLEAICVCSVPIDQFLVGRFLGCYQTLRQRLRRERLDLLRRQAVARLFAGLVALRFLLVLVGSSIAVLHAHGLLRIGGDEPGLIANKFPNIPVIVSGKRSNGIKYAINQHSPL